MAKWSEQPGTDRKQLFRRLAFNIATSNTDDHELNHGFVDGPAVSLVDTLQLAPAFDLVPSVVTNNRIYQGMLVGDDGAVSSFENAVTSARQFGLTEQQAWEIIDDVRQTVAEQWRKALIDSGVDRTETGRLERAFMRTLGAK